MKTAPVGVAPETRPTYKVLAAATIGSVIEWYDLFVYGSLVVVLSGVFFPSGGPVPPILPAIGAFVAGAAVRPLGGAVFGRYGDLFGRKYAFLMTTGLMGAGSVMVGLLPTYAQAGIVAPLALVALRLVQGLALGGEYGGGVTLIAENADDERRGYWASFAQSAGTVGLLLATVVSLLARAMLGSTAFQAWGWRLPFLGSSVLLVVAFVARIKLTETPLYQRLQQRKQTSASPLKESFSDGRNRRRLLAGLVVVSGAAVVWHTAQFYTIIFLQDTLKIGFLTAATAAAVAFALGAPFFILFGRLSDRVGRLKVILAGTVLGAISFYPTFYAFGLFARPPDLAVLSLLLFGQIFFSAMCYGPLGAFLVEYFPARVRYTSISVAYGIGTGDIGDGTLLIAPFIALALGNIYAGLAWSTLYPLAAAAVAMLYLRGMQRPSIWSEE